MTERVVVDAGVVTSLFIEGEGASQARTLFRRLEAGGEVAVPGFCLAECADAFRRQAQSGKASPQQAQEWLAALRALPLRIVPIGGLLPRALALGLSHDLGVYPALYIALAEQLGCPLVTADERLASAAQSEGMVVYSPASFAGR